MAKSQKSSQDAKQQKAGRRSTKKKPAGAGSSDTSTTATTAATLLASALPSAPTEHLPQMPKVRFVPSRRWLMYLYQWMCVTLCVYTLPCTMLFTAACVWWAVLLGMWVLLDLTGLVPVLFSWCGLCEKTLQLFVSTSLDGCLYAFGQVVLLGRGEETVKYVQDAVDERGGRRYMFTIGAVLYIAACIAYGIHIALDRRWQRAAVGRTDTLRFTHWFTDGIRGYFPAELYADVGSVHHGSKHLAFTRLDGRPGPNTEAAIDAAITLYPAQRTKMDPCAENGASTEKEPTRYLFCCHPHGLFTFAVWCTFNAWTRAFDRIFDKRRFITTVHTLTINFRFFIWRELLLDFRFSDVSRGTLRRALGGAVASLVRTDQQKTRSERRKARLERMARHDAPSGTGSDSATGSPTSDDSSTFSLNGQKKRSSEGDRHADRPRMSVLVPGGAEESVHCTEPKLTLSKRKGFIRMALTTGASLVPVYSFGETDLYRPMTKHPMVTSALVKLQKFIGVGTPLVVGRNVLNVFVPRRHPLRTVLGRPIDVRRYWRRAPRPTLDQSKSLEFPVEMGEGDFYFTDDDVERLHREYTDALKALYRKYQPRFDPDGPKEFDISA